MHRGSCLAAALCVFVACVGGPATGGAFDAGASDASGTSGGTGDAGCTTAAQNGDRACVPGTAQAGQATTVDVAASQGCLACFTTLDPCKVTVDGSTITLAMTATTCTPAGDRACPAICARISTKCTIPPLAVGTYAVDVAGEVSRAGLPKRELVVAATGGASSCSLDLPSPPINPSAYSRSCSADTDCRLITTTPCGVCTCETDAIATSASEHYDADFRAGASQCPSTGPRDVSCVPCAALKPKCVAPGPAAGTCTAAPGP